MTSCISSTTTSSKEAFSDSLLPLIQQIGNETLQCQKDRIVLILGSTGSGKSTLLNYLANKQLELDTSGPEDLIQCKNPLSPIGHGKHSCTVKPEIFPNIVSGITFCDCPGFFDNRGVVTEIANALTLTKLAKESKALQGIF